MIARRLAAEGLGTGLLLATVIGSGIMGERLADGNVAPLSSSHSCWARSARPGSGAGLAGPASR